MMSMEKDFDALIKEAAENLDDVYPIKVEVFIGDYSRTFYCKRINYGDVNDYDLVLIDVYYAENDKKEAQVRVPKANSIVYEPRVE